MLLLSLNYSTFLTFLASDFRTFGCTQHLRSSLVWICLRNRAQSFNSNFDSAFKQRVAYLIPIDFWLKITQECAVFNAYVSFMDCWKAEFNWKTNQQIFNQVSKLHDQSTKTTHLSILAFAALSIQGCCLKSVRYCHPEDHHPKWSLNSESQYSGCRRCRWEDILWSVKENPC